MLYELFNVITGHTVMIKNKPVQVEVDPEIAKRANVRLSYHDVRDTNPQQMLRWLRVNPEIEPIGKLIEEIPDSDVSGLTPQMRRLLLSK